MTTVQARRSMPLRVALAGAGMISWYHLVAWRNAGPRARVFAVCDPDARRASARAEEFGIPRVYQDAGSMLAGEDIDALDVASPRETHAAWVDAAAARAMVDEKVDISVRPGGDGGPDRVRARGLLAKGQAQHPSRHQSGRDLRGACAS